MLLFKIKLSFLVFFYIFVNEIERTPQILYKMKNNLLKTYLTVFVTFMSLLASAQPVDPPADPDPLPAPIDSQIIWLVVVGIAFAFYITNKKKVSFTK